MKKKLEAELISIAHKILQLKDTASIPQLQEQARLLYEKLSILNFAESHFTDIQPTIGQIKSVLEEVVPETTPNTTIKPLAQAEQKNEVEDISQSIEVQQTIAETPIKTPVELPKEPIPEIIIEKINEKVSEDLFVPATPKFTEKNISLSEPVYQKNDKENIESVPETMPILDKVNDVDEKPKSLNDQLKKGITIGLNDRLAFIKHLFDGSATDYNRVLSQLNTLHSKSGARQFILNMVKPDYNNWEGKDEYEERFIEIVTNKYEF